MATVALAGLLALTGCTGDHGTAAGADSPEPAVSADVDIPDLVEAVQPSVVTVLTPNGSGSGVVYDDDGTVITNEHVVRGHRSVELAFADGGKAAAKVIATDPVVDLAVLQSARTDAPPATFDTSLPRVGAPAIVLGSPLGFAQTVTAGIISGLHRSIPGSAQTSASLVDLIQTDAPISPGNSGGALVDEDGDVVGISEAYIPPQAGAVSIGFAIPAATVVEVVEELREDGTAEHAFLGLQPTTLTPAIAERLNVSAEEGVVILSVAPGGPAARAGVQAGDVVTEIAGERVSTAEDLLARLRDVEPGDDLPVTIVREGQTQSLTVTAGARGV